jgi:hypothetical protein
MIYRILNSFQRKASSNKSKTSNHLEEPCNCEHLLYGYVLWNNTYEDMWYLIDRNYITQFFAGGDYRDSIPANGYYKHKSMSELIKPLYETN